VIGTLRFDGFEQQAGIFTGAPTLTGEGAKRWVAVVGDAGESLYLLYAGGTVILFK
jgi:hypothetical protein